MPQPRALVTDVEGTTTPIAFVRDTLFPYARARLCSFVADHAGAPAVAALLDETSRLALGDPVQTLLTWMDADAKIGPLKTLQGLIWEEGYASGALRGALYPDVAPALNRLHQQGVALHVYSSGSIHAQRLLFGHAAAGNLIPLFSGFFDTGIGGKRDSASYRALAAACGFAPANILFLSDVEAELEAAQEAGWCALQVVRPDDATLRAAGFQQITSFAALSASSWFASVVPARLTAPSAHT